MTAQHGPMKFKCSRCDMYKTRLEYEPDEFLNGFRRMCESCTSGNTSAGGEDAAAGAPAASTYGAVDELQEIDALYGDTPAGHETGFARLLRDIRRPVEEDACPVEFANELMMCVCPDLYISGEAPTGMQIREACAGAAVCVRCCLNRRFPLVVGLWTQVNNFVHQTACPHSKASVRDQLGLDRVCGACKLNIPPLCPERGWRGGYRWPIFSGDQAISRFVWSYFVGGVN